MFLIFGFNSTTVICTNQTERKWLTSVKYKLQLAWSHNVEINSYIYCSEHWTGTWGVLQGCGWLPFNLHSSSALTDGNRYVMYFLFRENRKAITCHCLMSVRSTEITVPRHDKSLSRNSAMDPCKLAAKTGTGHWFHCDCVWRESESEGTASKGSVRVRLKMGKKSLWCSRTSWKTLSTLNCV